MSEDLKVSPIETSAAVAATAGGRAAEKIDPEAGQLMRNATYASVAVATTLIVAKIVAWLMTDSVALLSTLIDSVLDAAASLINLFAVRHALQPADHEHRFGHGKAEPLAGLAQGAFIFGSSMLLFLEAGQRMLTPSVVTKPMAGISVMVLSIVLTLILVMYQSYVVKKTRSVAIAADSLHYRTDLLVNGSVIISILLVTQMGWVYADPIFAICIACYILYGAYEIAKQAFDILMDHELPEEDRQKIKEIAMSHDDVSGLHDMRTRSSGTQRFIQMHLEMRGSMTLTRAHDVADEVMHLIEDAFPDTEVLIHQDPEGIDERVVHVD